jgi:hypothetical protein
VDDAGVTTDTAPPMMSDGSDLCASTNKPQATIGGNDAGTGPEGGALLDILTNTTLSCDKDWLLKGTVTVRTGATLTIQKGTTIKADIGAALLVAQGGKLLAQGEKDAPIVFTSLKSAGTRAPGDWVGLFLAGNAGPAGTFPIDLAPLPLPYGGGDAADSSGVLKYVRMEYPMWPLTMGGLGTGTTLDFVEVRRSAEDCYEWYGGTVNVKHLVCQSPVDDHFQFNDGYVGKAQFLLGQNAPPDVGRHGGIKINASNPTIYNTTLCGTAGPNQGYGLFMRNTPQGHMANTIVTGFNVGLDVFTAPGTPLELVSSVFFGNHAVNVAYVKDPAITDTNDPHYNGNGGFDENAWFATADAKNAETDPSINPACFDLAKPLFGPPTAIVQNAATPPADGFFDANAAYVGAVKDANDTWATGAWIVWSAQ